MMKKSMPPKKMPMPKKQMDKMMKKDMPGSKKKR